MMYLYGVRDLSLPATINAMSGETLSAAFEVVDPSQELRVALAWLEDSGDFLINNLDLRLTSPDPDGDGPLQPAVYFGNYFTDGGSVTLDLTGHARTFDLHWINVSTGDWGQMTTLKGGSKVNISAPGKSGWVATIVRQ